MVEKADEFNQLIGEKSDIEKTLTKLQEGSYSTGTVKVSLNWKDRPEFSDGMIVCIQDLKNLELLLEKELKIVNEKIKKLLEEFSEWKSKL